MIKAWTDYLYWQQQDRKTLHRINKLLMDIDRNGYHGIGKPEALRADLSGYWSRRIDADNPFLSIKLQFIGELRAKEIYGRAIVGNNFFASNKEPYGTPSFKAATDMPTVNSQRALPSV